MSPGKIWREFKWGLLALYILMALVVCAVYGHTKKAVKSIPENNRQKI